MSIRLTSITARHFGTFTFAKNTTDRANKRFTSIFTLNLVGNRALIDEDREVICSAVANDLRLVQGSVQFRRSSGNAYKVHMTFRLAGISDKADTKFMESKVEEVLQNVLDKAEAHVYGDDTGTTPAASPAPVGSTQSTFSHADDSD